MKRLRRLVPIALLAVVFGFAGCHEDEPTESSSQPTLHSMWPNEDGRFWSFEGNNLTWISRQPPQDPAPEAYPLPPLADLAELAAARSFPDDAVVTPVTYRLQFTDSITTESGVRRQNLVEVLEPVASTGLRPGSTHERFLRRLALARPDLRARIARELGSTPRLDGPELLMPFVLHGGAWEKTDQWIGTYSDLNTELAWKYLTPELRTGDEFAHQLVPELAADVYLRARVLGRKVVYNSSGTYTNAIEVFYAIDYGVSEVVDDTGTHLGWHRYVGYGSTHYVPEVGPVASYERALATWGPNGLGDGYGEIQFQLKTRGLTP